MQYDNIKDIFKAFPFALRRDIGGFVCVAFQDDRGCWSGRAWRLSDWRFFLPCETEFTSEAVFEFYRGKIGTLKELLAMDKKV